MNSTTITATGLPLRFRPLFSRMHSINGGSLSLVTPEGRRIHFGSSAAERVELAISSWSALGRIMRHGDIGLAECYRDGEVICSNLTGLLRLGLRNQDILTRTVHGSRLLNFGYRLRHRFRRNTLRGSHRNIQAHYDLGNDFYRLWLDPGMTYSSACFDGSPGDSLLQAQEKKYQRILDLLDAKAGDRILEVGCGWGGFAEYAARRGMKVVGLTLSRGQLGYARQRISDAGLSRQVELHLRDYRMQQGVFDHIVSIEMLEAVGEGYWDTYFSRLANLLKPGGRIAIQTIVIRDDLFEQYRRGTDFIQQYIFPGGMLPAPTPLRQLIERNGLVCRQEYQFGLDYAETLRRWRRRFEGVVADILRQGFDDRFIRLWRFYLAYCEAGFEERRIDVRQLLLSHGPDRRIAG